MTTARSALVSLDDTPFYHCIARCVRRAFLCGEDQYSGNNYNHRRLWLVQRLKRQAQAFSIDICAYAVMSNHYHVVLHVDSARAANWTEDEVISRWCLLFRGPLLVQEYLAGKQLSHAELDTIKAISAVWRRRLTDISWFMRCLNEYIARRANAEDDCKGRFWEGRFKSQALLDEAAVLSCMAYVDLNPLRAGISDKLDDSDFTSIQQRLRESRPSNTALSGSSSGKGMLMPFTDHMHLASELTHIPCLMTAYIDLLGWTGCNKKTDIRRAPPRNAIETLGRLNLSASQWLDLSLEVQKSSLLAIGSMASVARYNRSRGVRWLSGQRHLAALFENS